MTSEEREREREREQEKLVIDLYSTISNAR